MNGQINGYYFSKASQIGHVNSKVYKAAYDGTGVLRGSVVSHFHLVLYTDPRMSHSRPLYDPVILHHLQISSDVMDIENAVRGVLKRSTSNGFVMIHRNVWNALLNADNSNFPKGWHADQGHAFEYIVSFSYIEQVAHILSGQLTVHPL